MDGRTSDRNGTAETEGAAAAPATRLRSFDLPASAVVIGAGGGIGGALVDALEESGRFARVTGLSRRSSPPLDLEDERSVEAAAGIVGEADAPLRLVIDATGFLHDGRYRPEKALQEIDPGHLAHAFAINATGPALVMKHFLPLLPRSGKAVFATLSARVGSIGDNRIGGWLSYRASKAALNQIVRTAAVELGRRRKQAVCVALHPGTVDTRLSAPFSKSGLTVRTARTAAGDILDVIDGLDASASGGFFDQRGAPVPW